MIYFALEIIGTAAFAVSGAMAGIHKKMDIFGVSILGMTTAVGGGILRDLMIGAVPPMAFRRPVYALAAIAVSLLVFLPFIRSRINPDSTFLLITDSIGLGVFTAAGVKAGAFYDNVFLQIFLGTVTGVGGGVIRDIFSAETPMIFVRHFYASACILGAALCVFLYPFGENTAMLLGAGMVVILRLCAAKFRWRLPRA